MSDEKTVPVQSRQGAAPLHEVDESAVLRAVVEGTSTDTGAEFFRSLVKNLAAALDVRGAWLTEYLPEQNRLRARAFWLGGDFVPHYEYDVANTPCEPVVCDKRTLHIPDRAIELYPDDADLEELSAVSYLGVPLRDLDDRVMGHLAVLDNRPMPAEPRLFALFQVFANRAVAELRRLRAEDDVNERQERVERLLDSAMDAIVELDETWQITRANQAAETLFRADRASLHGMSFGKLLTHSGRDTLERFTRRLDRRVGNQRYLWIAGGLAAQRLDGEPLSAEATLSTFEMNRRSFYTLILRDVNERLDAERRIRTLEEQTAYLSEELESLRPFDQITGSSRALMSVLRDVDQVSSTDATVLILGETGTGKELIARAVHQRSGRHAKPLIKVNCAAIPANLIESELFGHERGAFTGATQRRLGRFALADGGTLFLDEVGELPLDLQSKLLRVLQEGEFEPLGSIETRSVDVRLVAATNRDLEEEIAAGRFREDLYYRLAVFPIRLPPLRERGDDVIALASEFAKRFAAEMGREINPLDDAAIARLRAYGWPGNIRELQNVIERAVITSRAGRLDFDRALPASSGGRSCAEDAYDQRILTVAEMRELERENIRRALEASGWKVAGPEGAARLLGMKQSTLSSRIRALGIKRPSD